MRILGFLESRLLELMAVAVILMSRASQACVGGPLTRSAASGTSEHVLALWQQQESPCRHPVPVKGQAVNTFGSAGLRSRMLWHKCGC